METGLVTEIGKFQSSSRKVWQIKQITTQF